MTFSISCDRKQKKRHWLLHQGFSLFQLVVLVGVSNVLDQQLTACLALSYVRSSRNLIPSRDYQRVKRMPFIDKHLAADNTHFFQEGFISAENDIARKRIQTCLSSFKGKSESMSHFQPRRIIVMGPPASGKGTQCEWIAQKYGLVHLSTGDMLRDEVENDTSTGSIGAHVKKYMDDGELVPDRFIISVLQRRLMQSDCQERGFILDGFPRTLDQAEAMAKVGIFPDLLLFLAVPDKVVIDRIAGRRIDPRTGKIYHLKYNKPPVDLVSELVIRSDDTVDKIKKRLIHYHNNAAAIRDVFEDICFVDIDGSGCCEDVTEQIRKALDKVNAPAGDFACLLDRPQPSFV